MGTGALAFATAMVVLGLATGGCGRAGYDPLVAPPADGGDPVDGRDLDAGAPDPIDAGAPVDGQVPLDGGVRGPLATCFRFDQPDRLAPVYGPATLRYWDPDRSGWGPQRTRFGTTVSFGLPPLPDGPARVMYVPALLPREGYELRHGVLANGYYAEQAEVSRYTLVLDVYYPAGSGGRWRSLYQTDPDNTTDADVFVRNDAEAGIGIDGAYHGAVGTGRWHRLAIVVRAADGEGHMQKYVDGTFVGGQGTTGSGIGERWALESTLLLFADDEGDTADVFVASILFVGEALLMGEVAALGGPTARGACASGAPAPAWPLPSGRRVDAIAHRGDSCCAPENTLAAIDQAFRKGADHVEVDVRLSRDGHAVLMHDPTLRRTTNARGQVSDYTVAELKALDAGSWFHPRFAGERVPTLAEAIALARGRGRLYLDVKVSDMGHAIQAALAAAGAGGDAVWPWAHTTSDIDHYRATIRDAAILYGDIEGWGDHFFAVLRSRQVFGFSIPWDRLTPEFAAAAHDNAMYVQVYTVLDRDRIRSVIDRGADAIETDYPAIVRDMDPR